jgi:prophage maintenance system killer protein
VPHSDEPDEIVYLSSDDLLILHDSVLRPNEDSTVLDENLVLSVAVRPQTTYFEAEQFPGLFVKAACLVESLAGSQMFYTGNKRTAWEAARVFLYRNGFRLTRMTSRAERHARDALIGRLLDDIAEKRITGPDLIAEQLELYYEPVDADELREALRRELRSSGDAR